MNTEQKNTLYKKLIRLKATGFISYGSLWLGADHLLLIESRRISEDYKRFYFGDIQAIVVNKTPVGKTLNVFFCSLVVFCGILVIFTGGSWIAAGFSLCFLLLLFINLLFGPTCQCHIQTAVQSARLAPVKRLRTARQIIARLKPHIESSQGKLTPEEIPKEMPASQFDLQKKASRSPRSMENVSTIQHPEKNLYFQVLFALLLVDIVFMATEFIGSNVFLSLVQGFVDLAIFIFTVICVVRLYVDSVRGALRPLVWTVLAYNAIRFAAHYALIIYYFMNGKINPNNQWEMLRFFSKLSPYDSPFLMKFILFSMIGSGALGVLGLLFVKRRQVAPQVYPMNFESRNETIRA